MENKPELKPCPFCGNPYPMSYGTGEAWSIRCWSSETEHYCNASTDVFKNSNEAATAWNTRALPRSSDSEPKLSERDVLRAQMTATVLAGYNAHPQNSASIKDCLADVDAILEAVTEREGT